MAINPRVAARREAENAFLNEEDERLKDLGEKRKKRPRRNPRPVKKGFMNLSRKNSLIKYMTR